ncbi:hypothetical protein L3X38_042856 [Prunus dulcis]|uniref:Uncharacterized protein n=1 Tax=Prunus dulcis TaxID=3755 RepID=A0AAD4UVC8_PRUDU|nr:hypothetical protein L3X38_042856 [Prunus dulcis]
MFARKSQSNKLFMKEELQNLRMEEGGNVMDHISTFNRCIVDLQRIEVVIVQRIRESSQGEGLVAKTVERGVQVSMMARKAIGECQKSMAKDGCFQCGSKQH